MLEMYYLIRTVSISRTVIALFLLAAPYRKFAQGDLRKVNLPDCTDELFKKSGTELTLHASEFHSML